MANTQKGTSRRAVHCHRMVHEAQILSIPQHLFSITNLEDSAGDFPFFKIHLISHSITSIFLYKSRSGRYFQTRGCPCLRVNRVVIFVGIWVLIRKMRPLGVTKRFFSFLHISLAAIVSASFGRRIRGREFSGMLLSLSGKVRAFFRAGGRS